MTDTDDHPVLQRLADIANNVYRMRDTYPHAYTDLTALLAKIGEVQLRLAQEDTDRATLAELDKRLKDNR